MRAVVMELIQDTDTGVYTLSQELPYTADGTALYTKNLKKIYVNLAQRSEEIAIATLDASNITNQTTRVQVYLANEARVLPSYDQVVTDLIAIKDSEEIRNQGYYRRQCEVSTEYEDNILITTLEYEFTKIK